MEFCPSMCNSPLMVGEETTRSRSAALGTDYWRLWSTSGLSNLADGVLKVAVPLVAIDFTRSPPLIAGLTFAFTLPWLLFALPAGALADRLDRRRLMLGANAVRVALLAALTLMVIFESGSILALYVVAVCVGISETVYDTSAQSIVPRVVDRDQLSRANGRLYAVELTANEFVGPPLAGLLTAVGVAFAFATPAALWAVAIGVLLLMRGSFRAEWKPSATTLRSDIAEGVRYLWRERILRTFAVMVGVFNFASTATQSILVLYAVGESSAVGLSEQAFGLLLSTIAVGSLLGSFVAEWAERVLGRARSIVLGFVAGALLIVIPALSTNPFLIGAGFLVGGAGIIISNVVMISLRQRITPDRLLGRVNSGSRFVGWGTKPLGAVVGGVLAQMIGLRAVFVIMGLVALAVLVGMVAVSNDAIKAAEREADSR